MSFKQASRLKLRFETSKGILTTEQLWDLGMKDLSDSIRTLDKTIKSVKEDTLDFLDESESKVDPIVQLKFDILKDIYTTRKSEVESARSAAEVKAHNQKILELIKRKKDQDLEGKSIEDLEKLLK